MYEILTGLTLDLYPFPSCRFSHSSIFCFRFSSSFWQSIIKQNTHEITTAIHTAALPISNINSSNWSDECLIKQQSRHSLHFDLLGKTYHISGNFCDDLIFVFCTISFKIANYQTTQKLYSLLFSKKTLFQSQKMTDENKKCYLFCCFRKFCDIRKTPQIHGKWLPVSAVRHTWLLWHHVPLEVSSAPSPWPPVFSGSCQDLWFNVNQCLYFTHKYPYDIHVLQFRIY